jgi:uncharacterized protein
VNNTLARRGQSVYNFFKNNNFKQVQFIPCLDPFNQTKSEYSLTPQRYGEFLKSTFDLYYNDFINGKYISIRHFDNYVYMLTGQHPESCGMSGVCTSYFVVESDGGVYPCDFYVLDQYKMGNLTLQTFSQLAKSEIAVKFREESKHIHSKCKSCYWLHICRGGCKRDREPFVDGKPGLNRFCEAYKEFFLHSAQRLNELAMNIRRNQV